LTLITGMQF